MNKPIRFNVLRQSLSFMGLPQAKLSIVGGVFSLPNGKVIAQYRGVFDLHQVLEYVEVGDYQVPSDLNQFRHDLESAFCDDIRPVEIWTDKYHGIVNVTFAITKEPRCTPSIKEGI